MLRIALPKGRLGDKAYRIFESIGYQCPEMLQDSRKLIFTNEEAQVSYFLVKPSDVSIYVEYGVADLGVVGKDVLLEADSEVYELLDLGFGKCRMAVAAQNDFRENWDRPLRVATKYPNIARRYYQAQNRSIDIIELHGSIELAPLLGLSDVIVDIVETGKTLKENGLSVRETIVPISARLIANKSSYQFHRGQIDTILTHFRKELML